MTSEELKSIIDDYTEDTSIFNEEDDTIRMSKKILWHKLSESDRRIILIYADTGSLRKTAKLIGVSVGTISSRIHKIQQIFKQCISH